MSGKAQGLTWLNSYFVPLMGADPEVFLQRDGKLIGSERVIPEEGLRSGRHEPDITQMPVEGKFPTKWRTYPFPRVIRDGVQAEFVIAGAGHSCREDMAAAIRTCFELLEPTGASIDWRTVVDVPREELMDLSEKSRILGCAPSLNIYGPREIGVPGDHPVRSAGGHVHLGISNDAWRKEIHANPVPLVALLDLVLGIPGVLLDRDPRASERRQVYGRAGEYRLPSYGLEYRTLSNFWLRAYVLHSMVQAAVRFATTCWNYDRGDSLLSQFSLPSVAEIINANDAPGAREVLGKVHTYMAEVHSNQEVSGAEFTSYFLLEDLAQWDAFTALGLDHFWPTSRGWRMNWDGRGWETFKSQTISWLKKVA